ncbi:4084_t:CDS:2, partial [Acaulospora colombiana]
EHLPAALDIIVATELIDPNTGAALPMRTLHEVASLFNTEEAPAVWTDIGGFIGARCLCESRLQLWLAIATLALVARSSLQPPLVLQSITARKLRLENESESSSGKVGEGHLKSSQGFMCKREKGPVPKQDIDKQITKKVGTR